MKNVQTVPRILKVLLDKVDVCVKITIIALKNIIIHNYVTVSVSFSFK